ncbi:aminotransferase class I/II-fold pyridoxal phosphate-dependent enzyme [Pseudonocardia sp. KRD-184]|uniref:Aminotransferase class I/II-fold pyridoxal phosphate-dependent enzyme n=1 Tax=Pseudonocardia oceani TaxID=2792013 RepID=A0ABS6U8K4_9PSEU|nr:GntG family PLP-dependent aldolase [Pseudonocardia oceani]MBW0093306.1 aminotransferase class I/II-fold pyridoxal phosphate-dependent enzyme [Pseudonocardia oceani]MBW0100288.1 aminotransferase class I/II-fold pyridoxal phosphate-dependent enzyme [Pseudonocardia oceani]MBW0112724.1 aminotransferase class I/II-fold pyridoxal phosphate-dependent enzyme [Pseudonocardia oceani]MBW0124677.1 aminotransferase class I/II-fold pyridoxal phosphate-dependent enzyme [Pseudonocardia oceani]MBW0128556.1 
MRPTSRSRRASAKAGPIDLRSDTVTQPTKEMRAAMAAAEVGDDVLDRDPTMRELETRVAGLLGAADALWTPSGSMGNLIALMAHMGRGDAFLAPAGAHVLDAELGTAAWLAGGMPRPLPHDGGPGKVTPDAVRRAAGSTGPYYTLRTTLLCLENTHNASGGTVTAPEEHAAVAAAARAAKLRVHLDGARLWNAAAALGVPPGALTVGADTVQVCLSKGLGAPVGSVVAGSWEFVEEARRLRKMLGGGVRQGGVLAAAGLVALDRIDRLADDHRRARTLAVGLRERGWQAAEPQTNIVLVAVADLDGTLRRLEEAGVRASAMSGQVRLMTHADVGDADIAAALDRIGAPGGSSPGRSAYAPAQRGLRVPDAGRAPVRPSGR